MQFPIIPSSEQRITNQWLAGWCKHNFQILLLQLIIRKQGKARNFTLRSTEFFCLYLVELSFTKKKKNFKNIL